MKMDGYVIVPSVNSWDDKEAVWLGMAYSSFGKNPVEAWIKFTGYPYDDPNRSSKIQYWHDKGYRLKKATLEIIDD